MDFLKVTPYEYDVFYKDGITKPKYYIGTFDADLVNPSVRVAKPSLLVDELVRFVKERALRDPEMFTGGMVGVADAMVPPEKNVHVAKKIVDNLKSGTFISVADPDNHSQHVFWVNQIIEQVSFGDQF